MDGIKMLFLPLLDLCAHSCACVYRVGASGASLILGLCLLGCRSLRFLSCSLEMLLVLDSLLLPSLILHG